MKLLNIFNFNFHIKSYGNSDYRRRFGRVNGYRFDQNKKSAAHAFESEIIETENFRLVKPAGFIHPLREVSDYAFEAYSKEFGEKDRTQYLASASLFTVSEGLNFNTDLQKHQTERRTKFCRKKF